MKQGEFDLKLGEYDLKLRCSPLALRAIETKHGGIRAVTQSLYDVNFRLIQDMIEAGLQGGARTIDKEGLEREIFDAGVMNLVEPMMEYLMLLGNGGKPPTEEEPKEGEA